MAFIALVAGLKSSIEQAPAPDLPTDAIGVNLAGAEFTPTALPGALGPDYLWPTADEVNYYAGKGFTFARIPFLMERLWPDPLQDVDCTYLDDLLRAVDAVRAAGMWAMPDLHNFWQYRGQLITQDQMVFIWSRLALAIGARDRIVLGLMNEPNGVAATTVVAVQNAVISAIRALGYSGVIAVSGTAWTGAHSWVSSGNAAAFAGLSSDPGVVIEVHQYLDADGVGDSTNCAVGTGTLAGDGAFRLTAFTGWARTAGRKALLTEWSYTPANSTCQTWAPAMLSYMDANPDVWLGHAYWANYPTAYGPHDSNPQLLNPLAGGTDRAQIAVITGIAPPPAPASYPIMQTTAGTRTGAASKQAWEADQFVAAGGCLMQQFDTNSVSGMISLVGRSSRVARSAAEANPSAINQLKSAGVKFLLHGGVYSQVNGATPATPAQLVSTVKKYGVDAWLGVSTVNEPNHASKITNSSTYWTYLRNYQRDVFNAFQADAATKDKVLVLSPGWAFNEEDLIPSIGDIDQWIHGHQCHAYPKARNIPERTDIFRSIDMAFTVGSPQKPVFIGECGYNTQDSSWTPDTDAVARKDRFMPRLFLYYFDHGTASIVNYIMNYVGGGTGWSATSGDSEDAYGWLKPDGTKQSSYTSSMNLFSMLADPGPRWSPGTLNYSITGATTNLMYTLLQKRNGRFYLAVWVATYDNATRAITISLPSSITTARRGRPNTSQSWSSQAISNSAISYTADGFVTLFELF